MTSRALPSTRLAGFGASLTPVTLRQQRDGRVHPRVDAPSGDGRGDQPSMSDSRNFTPPVPTSIASLSTAAGLGGGERRTGGVVVSEVHVDGPVRRSRRAVLLGEDLRDLRPLHVGHTCWPWLHMFGVVRLEGGGVGRGCRRSTVSFTVMPRTYPACRRPTPGCRTSGRSSRCAGVRSAETRELSRARRRPGRYVRGRRGWRRGRPSGRSPGRPSHRRPAGRRCPAPPRRA